METNLDRIDSRGLDSRVKAHMAKYKRDVLKTTEDGIWKSNKQFYKHILPEKLRHKNIIEPYRDSFFNSPYAKVNFHRDFHHLNSSQAMCINFFYPLIAEQQLHLILPFVGIKTEANDKIINACFERESKLEKFKRRKTSFDFYMQIKSETNIFFEIKYLETGFGKAARDEEHLNNYYKVYKPLLNSNPAIKDNCKNGDCFLNHYQIMRNLLQIDAKSTVVFIYPQDNQKIHEEALQARATFLMPGWESKFMLYTWEKLLEKLFTHLNYKKLIDYYHEFEEKYLGY